MRRRVVVGDFDSGFPGDAFAGVGGEADDGEHSAGGGFAGFLHVLAAGAEDADGVFEGEGAPFVEGRPFAAAEARRAADLEGLPDAVAEGGARGGADDEDGGLGVAGAGEFFEGAFEAHLQQVEAEDVAGAREEGAAGFGAVGEVGAHADGLGALSGEEEAVFHR